MTGRSPPRRLSLQHKLPLMIALLLVGLGIAGSFLAYVEVRNSAVEASRERLGQVTRQLSELMEAAVEARLEGMAAAAVDPQVATVLESRSPPPGSPLPAVLEELASLEGTLLVELWRPSGEVVASVGTPPDGWTAAQIDSVRTLRPAVDGAGYSAIAAVGDARYVWALHPVERRGETLGTVAQLRPVGAYAASRQIRNLIGPGTQIYFVNYSGGPWITLAGDERPQLLDRLPDVPTIYAHPDGTEYMGYALPAGSAGFSVLAEIPMAEVLGRAHALVGRLAGAGLLLILLGMMGGFLISRSIVTPLGRLGAAARAIAAGDYSRRVELDRGDELGDLARSFDDMAARIESSQRELEDRYREMEALTRRLEENNRRLEAAMGLTQEARTAAEEANRAKSEFVATISHEVRTPLNSVVGYAELLKLGVRGPLTGEQEAQVDRILANARLVVTLLDELLDLASVEAGRMSLVPETGRIGTVVDEALAVVKPEAERKNIRLERLIEDPEAAFHADPKRVRQILLNLLSNAIKFTDEGGRIAAVTARAAASESDGSSIAVTVQDTGPGIAEEETERIFEPFIRSGTPGDRAGVGLGLAISRRMARLMGGDLTVDSSPGRGSAFTVRLPVPPEDGLDVEVRTPSVRPRRPRRKDREQR